MSKEIIEKDIVTTTAHYDDVNDRLTIERSQDIGAIIKNNKALYNETTGYTPSKDFKRVASIPAVIVEDLIKKKIWNDKKKMKQWLNDPENRFFRTSPGCV